MDINFELYKVFYTVAKSGSFSAAAKELYITQSAVSQSIKNLENKLGTCLLIRGTRSIRLTNAGEMLMSHVDQAYNLLKLAEHKINEMKSLSLGELRIGVGDTILRYLLTPFLQHFLADYPNIKLQIINRTSSGIIDSIKKGAVDFGIATMPVKDNDIEAIEFCEVEDVFVASSRFDKYRNMSISLNELSGIPLLLLQKDSMTRRNLDDYFTSKGISITPEIELESVELLVEYARIGLGVAHVLKESAAAHIRSGELFTMKLDDPMPGRKLCIAKLKTVPLPPAASAFVDRLKSSPLKKH